MDYLFDSALDRHLSKRHNLRAGDARLQGIIDLLNSAPSFYSSAGENLKRKLPPKQWNQPMRAIRSPKDHTIRVGVEDDVW